MLNIFAFLCAKLFPILIDIIELHGCMMIFAFNCNFFSSNFKIELFFIYFLITPKSSIFTGIIGSFFIYFVVDETTGKHMDQLKTEQPKTNDQSKA